jgi:predicted amidophosphoribosyltransferase
MKNYDFIFDYTPFFRGGANDKLSRVLLNFKRGHESAFSFMRSLAVNYFDLSYYDKSKTAICGVPSHTGSYDNPVQRLCRAIADDCNFIDATLLVRKIYETDSFCRGGIRDSMALRNSIEVDRIVNNLHIILIDDVATTGTSFKVVSDLLMQAGAASVNCIALGQTVKLSERRLQHA